MPNLFRQRALDRIGSPDEFDRLVRVTSPRHWIGLGGLLIVVVATLLWASFSTIPTTESGAGFLLPEGGLRTVEASADGEILRLDVELGDHVIDGQQLGVVRTAGGREVAIRASGTGVVSEANGQRGEFVRAGDQLALVEPIGWPAVVFAYVPTEAAGDIAAGTEARVRFSGGIGATYGDALGRVVSVSRFPTTPARLEFVLHGAAVSALPAEGVPTSEVLVALDQSATTPSGLVWATGSGPASVPLGLPATVELVIGSRHPIDDVF